MEQIKTAICAALAALTLASLAPHSAFADGDKGKKKKDPVPIVIGKPVVTPDPPKK